MSKLALVLCLLGLTAKAQTLTLAPGPDLEQRLTSTLASAPEGATVTLPEGRFEFQHPIVIKKSRIQLRGQGRLRTVLVFQPAADRLPAIELNGSHLRLEGLSVLDAAGDGIFVHSGDSQVLRDLRISWQKGRNHNNGRYAIHLSQVRSALVEESEVSRASDTGVFIEQSRQVIIRRVHALENTVGIEAENSTDVDLTLNRAEHNTGGIFASAVPELPVQLGTRIRIFDNEIVDNNAPNLLPATERGHVIPPGLGTLLLAVREVEVFHNRYAHNRFISIAIDHFEISGPLDAYPDFRPRPEAIHVHDNQIDHPSRTPVRKMQMSLLFSFLFKLHIPAIMDDGIQDGTYSGQPRTGDQRICLRSNLRPDGGLASFGNAHLDHQRRWLPLPGGPVTRDLAPYDCELPPLPAVSFKQSGD